MLSVIEKNEALLTERRVRTSWNKFSFGTITDCSESDFFPFSLKLKIKIKSDKKNNPKN